MEPLCEERILILQNILKYVLSVLFLIFASQTCYVHCVDMFIRFSVITRIL